MKNLLTVFTIIMSLLIGNCAQAADLKKASDAALVVCPTQTDVFNEGVAQSLWGATDNITWFVVLSSTGTQCSGQCKVFIGSVDLGEEFCFEWRFEGNKLAINSVNCEDI